MANREPSRLDAWLDLLTDEVAERLAARRRAARPEPEPQGIEPPVAAPHAAPAAPGPGPAAKALPDPEEPAPTVVPVPVEMGAAGDPEPSLAQTPAREPAFDPLPTAPIEPGAQPVGAPASTWPAGSQLIAAAPPASRFAADAAPGAEPAAEPAAVAEPALEPPPAPANPAAVMARLALAVGVIVALINVPLNAQGTALARSIPSSASLVIRNGLVVKEATSPEIWAYRDGAFHWIPSLDAFQHFGYRWEDVHIVEPGFLNGFEKGRPLYLVVKCDTSPHVYRIEEGRKRWIVDIPTFQAEGYAWRDVKFVSCGYLRNLPDGESIPPGHGSPPPPLP